jgi:hypothetical protein
LNRELHFSLHRSIDWRGRRKRAPRQQGGSRRRKTTRQNKLLAPSSIGCNLATSSERKMTDSGRISISAKSRDSDEIHFSQSKTGTDAANYVTISPCAQLLLQSVASHLNYGARSRRDSQLFRKSPQPAPKTARCHLSVRPPRARKRANSLREWFKILTARRY